MAGGMVPLVCCWMSLLIFLSARVFVCACAGGEGAAFSLSVGGGDGSWSTLWQGNSLSLSQLEVVEAVSPLPRMLKFSGSWSNTNDFDDAAGAWSLPDGVARLDMRDTTTSSPDDALRPAGVRLIVHYTSPVDTWLHALCDYVLRVFGIPLLDCQQDASVASAQQPALSTMVKLACPLPDYLLAALPETAGCISSVGIWHSEPDLVVSVPYLLAHHDEHTCMDDNVPLLSRLRQHHWGHDAWPPDFFNLMYKHVRIEGVAVGVDEVYYGKAGRMSKLQLYASSFTRKLAGTGYHRTLVTEVVLAGSTLACNEVNVAVVDVLPIGMYPNQYELDGHAQVGAGPPIKVFGNVDMEQPAPFCEQSIMVTHLDMGEYKGGAHVAFNLSIPLHARYAAPLANSTHKHSIVHIPLPHVLLSCRKGKDAQTTWVVASAGVAASAHDRTVQWPVPMGSPSHAFAVSVITYAACICGTAVIVWVALRH
eukprot:jgi/Chlat1/8335/Chrsp8S08106